MSCAQLKLLFWLVRREPVTGITFHLDQTTTWQHRIYRNSVRTVDIGRVCLAIWIQNGAEISICGVEMFLCIGYPWATVNYDWKWTGVSKYLSFISVNLPLNHVHVLLTAICCVKWYLFVCFSILHVAFIDCFPVGVTYLSHTKSGLSDTHRLMNSLDIYKSTYV